MDMRWTNPWVHKKQPNVIIEQKAEVPKVNEFKGLVHMISELDYEDEYWSIKCN